MFLWWEDAAGKSYAAGELLPAGDVALTATWKAIPIVEPEQPETDAAPSAPDQEGSAEDLLSPPLEENIGTNTEITPETGRENHAPAIAAGVVVGVLTAVLLFLWFRKKSITP